MRADIREKIDEIELVVDALDELSQMMQKNNMETPGGTCMALLARKIESELNALWLILKRVDSSMAAE
jgi:hypothetical protein